MHDADDELRQALGDPLAANAQRQRELAAELRPEGTIPTVERLPELRTIRRTIQVDEHGGARTSIIIRDRASAPGQADPPPPTNVHQNDEPVVVLPEVRYEESTARDPETGNPLVKKVFLG